MRALVLGGYGAGTVAFDEHRLSADDVRALIERFGCTCGGELVPYHLCRDEQPAGSCARCSPGPSRIDAGRPRAKAADTRSGSCRPRVPGATERTALHEHLPAGPNEQVQLVEMLHALGRRARRRSRRRTWPSPARAPGGLGPR